MAVFMTGCKKNEAPVISSLECTPENGKAGTIFTFKVTASDNEGDQITYHWSAVEGNFLSDIDKKEIQWKSPITGAGKPITVNLVISDGEKEVKKDINLLLEDPDLGNVSGHVYYTNFKIPVEGVTVTEDTKTTRTNQDGYFELSGIPAIVCTLMVAKQDFSNSELTVSVPANRTLTVNPEITSVMYSTKLSGIVQSPTGQPIGNAKVVVLNPDGSESKLNSTTNSSGFYRLWYIPFGERTILVTKPETSEIRYLDLIQSSNFQEIEMQLPLTLQTLALTGQFTDTRDNHKYQYKIIGKVMWMTENLSYLPEVAPSAQVSASEARYYIYGYQGSDIEAALSNDNYKQYGALYNWPAALKACPADWHLPASDLEWNALLEQYASQTAIKLKSKSGWAENGNGDNASGFSAIPGGEVTNNGTFSGKTVSAAFWTSTRISGNSIYRGLNSLNKEVYSQNASDKNGFSIRCVKDL